MTERLIQNELWKKFNRANFKLACPNYTPVGWFECDLFAVTKSDIGVEYEIKITRKDFRDDSKKTLKSEWRKLSSGWGREAAEGKHTLMASKSTKAPNRFYYVVPEDLITFNEIPPWAGLIYIRFIPATEYHAERYHIYEVVKAPLLHKEKVKASVLDHMRGVFYWRYWNLRTKQKEIDEHRSSEEEVG